MNVWSPVWYVLCMAALLLVVRLPVFSHLDVGAARGSHRAGSIDGLRGFLALGVVFHHAAVYRQFLVTGVWAVPPSSFYTMLGQVGVSLFFMITGYLFWGKLLADKGRPAWRALYVGRIFRIGPVYFLTIGAMLAVIAAASGGVAHEPAGRLVREVLHWCLLGFYGTGPDINAYRQTFIVLAGVLWTLSYEWRFYLALLPLSLFARSPRWGLIFVLGGLVMCLIAAMREQGAWWVFWADFFVGMCCASVPLTRLKRLGGSDAVLSAMFVASLAAVLLGANTAYAVGPVLLMAPAFLAVAAGASGFGLLSSRAALRLGESSFGIYLLQGIFLFVAFAVPAARRYALQTPLHYWSVVLVAAMALVGASALAHIAIERPGIALGKRVAAWLADLSTLRALPRS